ncbi:MAG TPA: NAD-dependent epimerase/dehydratase family protein [Amnibacterium sp.]|jgi:nucleoside-diphosphate-sugar epimerase|uniref:NAD-dependent epimerase/dehydratase family protein n=1 Tax=Amnibacterium sp. TaxID=1872496 RepID=UPI002F941C6A
MRVIVIGATGHVGGYLVPRLVEAGHDVVAVSRGRQRLYREHPAWDSVTRVVADRAEEDAAGVFGARVAALQPDAVIDMACFTEDSAAQLLAALAGTGAQLLMCGTIWVHGRLTALPARESDRRHPWGEYGIQKTAIERLVLEAAARGDVRGTVLHPGHISGPGWAVINPVGNLDLTVWERLATGQRVVLPNLGAETLAHVHADDVAQAFQLALEQPGAATGHAFHVVAERALALRGFAEAVAGWFGADPDLAFLPFDEWRATTTPEHADTSYEHVARSHVMSIDAARTRLGYAPAFTALDAVREAVAHLAEAGRIRVPAFV